MPLPFIKFGHCPFPYSNGPVVKRLRLRPFTAATRVRVPSGSPPIFSRSIWRHSSAGRASASHAEGHRFEFCCLHQNKKQLRKQLLFVLGFGGFAAFTLRRLQCSAEVNSACAKVLDKGQNACTAHLRRRPEGRDRGGSAGDLLQSLFLRRRKMRCSRIFLFSVLEKRKEEIVVRHF